MCVCYPYRSALLQPLFVFYECSLAISFYLLELDGSFVSVFLRTTVMLVISGCEQGYCCYEMLRRVVIVLCWTLSVPFALWCIVCRMHCSFPRGWPAASVAEMVTQPALPSHYFSLCLQRKGKLLCCICSCSTDRTDTWYLQDGVWPFCFRYALYCVRAVGLAFGTPSQWLPPPLSGAACSIWSVQPIAKHLQKQGCCWYCHKSATSPCVKIQ